MPSRPPESAHLRLEILALRTSWPSWVIRIDGFAQRTVCSGFAYDGAGRAGRRRSCWFSPPRLRDGSAKTSVGAGSVAPARGREDADRFGSSSPHPTDGRREPSLGRSAHTRRAIEARTRRLGTHGVAGKHDVRRADVLGDMMRIASCSSRCRIRKQTFQGVSADDLRRRRCFPLRDVEFVRGENEELFARLKKSGGHVMRTGVDQAGPVFIRQFSRGPAAH